MPDGSHSDLQLLIICAPSQKAVPQEQDLLALSSGARIVADPAIAEAGLSARPAARLVLLCPKPDAWVALALADGLPPSESVEAWRISLRPLLALLRARRRQTVLLFDEVFAADPAACAAALGLPAPPKKLVPHRVDDPVLVMIAREALRRDLAAQALVEELEASGLALDDTEPDANLGPDAIFQAYTDGLRRAAANDAETAFLHAQILRDADAARDADARLSQERNRTATAQKAHDEAAAHLILKDEEIRLLRTQVALSGTAMGQLQAALSAERPKIAAAEARVKVMEAAEQFATEAHTKAEAEFGQMNAQLRAQIHQVGQGLESYHVQVASLQAERTGLLSQISQLNDARADLEGYYDRAQQLTQQVDVLTADIARMQADLTAAQDHIERVQTDLTSAQDHIGLIHRSLSYRLMTPLRKMRTLMG